MHRFHTMFCLPPLTFFLLQLPNFLCHPLPFHHFSFLLLLLLLLCNLPKQLCLNLCLLSQSLLHPFFLFLLLLSLLLQFCKPGVKFTSFQVRLSQHVGKVIVED